MKFSLNINLRRLISFGCALIVGSIIEYYYSLAHNCIIPLTAVIVMLTPVGNLFYQGMLRFFVICIALIMVSELTASHHMISMRIYDACIGAAVGILINLLILPRQADVEFRNAVLPLLKVYEAYFISIVDSLFEKNEAILKVNKIKVEKQLNHLPVWVNVKGFDKGLRPGYQYFLMKLHQMSEILFAMHHAARCRYDYEVKEIMRKPMMLCVDKIKIFFNALTTVFALQNLKEGVEDFETELHVIDVKFQELLPPSLDLLAMSQDDVLFYEIIYTLNDLRKTLIKLSQALR